MFSSRNKKKKLCGYPLLSVTVVLCEFVVDGIMIFFSDKPGLTFDVKRLSSLADSSHEMLRPIFLEK